MNNFNHTLVEYLDLLNKVLAGIFAVLAALKFLENIFDAPMVSIFETLTIVGAGILTCGYIALMLNINRVLEEIRDQHNK